jgi:radical SAM superfamily enzyme YgiQ (UPF0313 family)
MTWQQLVQTSRFLGNEQGTIHKDWGGRLPIALVFPNTYYLGMSSLAVHTLYRLWNAREDVVCERVFTDLIPPVSLESGAPLHYFPVLAVSITYEMDYFNLVQLLRAADIPPRAADRDETHPLIVAGGPAVSANPEPLAPLLDAIVIGEVEPIFGPLAEALHLVPENREEALAALARLPGLYVPSLSFSESEPQPVRRQWARDLDRFPTYSALFTPGTEFTDMGLIEIARGCGRGCRFCLAGYTYRPPRERSVESILAQARDLLRTHDRLGLVSAAVSDHTEIDRLAVELRNLGARLSVSSMRVDPISEPLIRALAESGVRTMTIAPEAGSERLRQVIGKTQTADDVLRAVDLAARYNLEQVKLYFMLGLPTEDDKDVQALVDLAQACAKRFARQVTVNITPFVPKAHTPFQRRAQTPATVVKSRLAYVERKLRRQNIGVKSESPAWSEIQGTLARGDRHVAEALLAVDRLSPAAWRRALADAGLSAEELLSERAAGTLLPWRFVRVGVHPERGPLPGPPLAFDQ